MTLSWSNSRDDTGVKGYEIIRDGIKAGTTPYCEYSDSGLSEGTAYQYCVKAYDAYGNISQESNKITVTTNTRINGTGAITREYWGGIGGSLDSLRRDRDFPGNPDVTDQSVCFASPAQLGNNYGERMSGFVCPSAGGRYTFFISSDDSGELWLSTDDNPGNKRMIAKVSCYTGVCQWLKYRSQKSAAIYLEAGKKYYIEALHAQGCRANHLEVGWQPPGSNSIVIIPGEKLMPLN